MTILMALEVGNAILLASDSAMLMTDDNGGEALVVRDRHCQAPGCTQPPEELA